MSLDACTMGVGKLVHCACCNLLGHHTDWLKQLLHARGNVWVCRRWRGYLCNQHNMHAPLWVGITG
jgi:hypothetical protein